MREQGLDVQLHRELSWALTTLFGESAVGRGFLETPSGSETLASGCPTDRVKDLLGVLVRSVVNMARELEELGDVEGERLRAEARATLIAIRELASRFPDCIESSDHEVHHH